MLRFSWAGEGYLCPWAEIGRLFLVDDRLNPEGVPRHQLTFFLTQARVVRSAVQRDCCLLCCDPKVNEAGLCHICFAYLTDEEYKLAEHWITGVMPE
ncbi:MAG: hypothetical protein R2688_07560 [Fimbriimonadaceae bacterium]